MKKMTIRMPVVSNCVVGECAYNDNNACHAKAITIGHGTTPGCDTYFANSNHSARTKLAGVGACKVTDCAHNVDLECTTHSIEVGKVSGSDVRCMSYAAKS